MSNSPKRPPVPNATPPVPRAAATADTAILEKVAQKYGSFGARPSDDVEVERRALSDNFLKPAVRIVAGVFAATLVASVVSHPAWGGPGMWANSIRLDTLFAVVWMPLLWNTMMRKKLSRSLRVYLVLALFIEAFSEAMFRDMGVADGGGYWDTVMWPASVAWYGTLKEFAGIPGASLSTFFFVTVALLYRAVNTRRDDPPPKFAKQAMLAFLGAVIGLAIVGVARGGAIEPAFRQTIHLMQLPLVGLLFLYALRIPDDLPAIGTVFVVCAVARSLLVAYVYFGVCMPAGITSLPGKPEWCTNHSDSVLFVTAILVLICHALEQRKLKVTLKALAIGAVILLGIILNNRRLAFVSLGAAPFVVFLAMKPSKRKRRLTAALAILTPLLAGYVLIGSEIPSASPLLKPAKLVVSVMDQKDTSSLSRDIENENLIYTLSETPVVPLGFGHEYDYSPNNPPVDLGELFKNFRYIAHNGVLWIWSLGGVLGFSLLWFVYPLAGTLALRAYWRGNIPLERTAALACLGSTVVCIVQIWGDQGFNSYMTLVTFGVTFAVAAKLAARVHA